MLGIPMHPLVIHFPIVFAVLLPIAVIAALVTIRRGASPRRAWTPPLALAAALTLSAFAATQSGGAEEDRVERVVGEQALHEHEEAGERFLVLSGVLLLVAAVGLAPRTVGQAARVVTAVGAIVLVGAGLQVGHSGGSLVYQHGAASAYTADSASVALRATAGAEREDDDH
ncbi:MAG TPA: transglutaminaseTgpA domain-containing protein [Gemmatimonadaceae bacterium]|nr:transglutaminaseTgpA domain-containing protein [Gemmatimonadaceae bacterium]